MPIPSYTPSIRVFAAPGGAGIGPHIERVEGEVENLDKFARFFYLLEIGKVREFNGKPCSYVRNWLEKQGP